MHLLKNINPLLINHKSKFTDVIKKMTSTKKDLVFVVGDDQQLLGSISGGDIRRYLLKKNQDLKITKMVNKNLKYFYKSDLKKFRFSKINDDINYYPVVDKKKRIKSIIYKPIIKQKIINTVFLMAGGKGKRLYPLTKFTPKPLLKINNVPIIERIIKNFKNFGYSNFLISIKYLGRKIKKYLKNGNKIGVKISYIEEKKFLGTAGSLSLIKNKKVFYPIIVSNSDLITNINYNKLLNFHKNNHADITICVKNKIFEVPYGTVIVKKNLVKNILEKPTNAYIINAGVYVIEKKILNTLKVNSRLMMNDFITEMVKKKFKVFYYPIFENWIDIGNKVEFNKINK